MNNLPIQSQDILHVKIYLGSDQEASLRISSHSDVDSVIQECIDRHRLKKQAHGFLKSQIQSLMKMPNDVKRLKTEINPHKESPLFLRHLPLSKNRSGLKNVNIDRKNNNQKQNSRTELQNKCKQKQQNLRLKEGSQASPKIYLKRKTQSEKQNLCTGPVSKTKYMRFHAEQCSKKRKQKESITTNQSVVIKNDSQIGRDSSRYLQIGHLIKPPRLMTEPSQIHKLKQLSFTDLEMEMNNQMADLKIEKRIQRLEPQLCNLFRSIIRYNPPKINKIDPRYACFEELSENVIKGLHEFLRELPEHELNSLDFDNFKKLLIKYKAVKLLASLK